MSFGKMNGFAELIATKNVKDSEGFSTTVDEVLASIRVYREGRHGGKDGQILAHFLRPPPYSACAGFPELRLRRIKSSFQTETALRSSPLRM